MADPASAKDVVRFRFKVRTADGQVQESNVVEMARPPDPPEEPPEAQRPVAGKLGVAEWSQTEFDHGADAGIQVHAPGLNGREVKFVIEHQAGKKWKPYETLRGVVQDNFAKVTIQLQHPSTKGEVAASEDVRPVSLRFHAELVDN